MDYLQDSYDKFVKTQSYFKILYEPNNEILGIPFKEIDIPSIDLIPNYDTKQKLSTEELFEILGKYATVDILNHSYISFSFREQIFVHVFGWSVPSIESLNEAVNFIDSDTVLEIAAGVGFWSRLLRSKNVNVHTTSIVDGHYYKEMEMEQNIWTPIELLSGVDAVQKYTDANCLFLSWGNGVLYEALPFFKGNKVIIIGEDSGGCTDYLESDDFELVKCIDIPKWYCLHDEMRFYVRK